MEDRVVLLTGGGGGIARGVARAFADEGAKMILTDIFPGGMEKTKAELERDFGTEVFTYVADGAKEEQVDVYKRQIHNNEATFYDRNHVFAQLGFDTFTPIEYMNNIERNPTGWCRDKILTKEIIKTLDSTPGPDYIYTISVQGHGKYPDFEYYCSQIAEMDDFIRSLVNTMRTRQEPIVLVMSGDHLPSFEWSEEEMENGSLYQTEYVVWNNMNLPKEKKDVEAYQLAAHVLDLLDIHEGTMMRFHQKYLNGQQKDEEAYLTAMKALEYDILYGNREIYGGETPYQTTDLKMGIDPVTIDQIV